MLTQFLIALQFPTIIRIKKELPFDEISLGRSATFVDYQVFDFFNQNPDCTKNTWLRNLFGSANLACVQENDLIFSLHPFSLRKGER